MLDDAQTAGANFVDSEFSKITGSNVSEEVTITSGTQTKPSIIPNLKPTIQQPPVQEEELILDGCGVYLSG